MTKPTNAKAMIATAAIVPRFHRDRMRIIRDEN